jgi:hypothetical protein
MAQTVIGQLPNAAVRVRTQTRSLGLVSLVNRPYTNRFTLIYYYHSWLVQ